MTALTSHPANRPARYRAPVLATWACAAVAVGCLVGAAIVPELDQLNRTTPLVFFGLIWAVAAYRLYHRGRGRLATGLAIMSVSIAVISAVITLLWVSPWAGNGTLQLTAAGAVQLAVPLVGAVVVLLALRRRTP